jgi:COP9 signalosome complex subunit 2
MDDDDADYMQGSEDEDYGFDYSDGDEANQSGSADVENMYYTAKSKKEDNPEEALNQFRAIVDQEEEMGDWGFKALKQSTKLLFLTLRRPADALKTYIRLLTYTKSAVTRNYSEKTINGILDYVGGGKSGPIEVDVLERFYQATKDALIEAKNERLSVKTNLKLAKLWLDRKEYGRLSKLIRDLHRHRQHRRRRPIPARDSAARDLRARDPDVQRDAELQEIEGDIQRHQRGSLRHPPSADHGRY